MRGRVHRGIAVKGWLTFNLIVLELPLSQEILDVAASVLWFAFLFRTEFFRGHFDSICYNLAL